MKSDISIFLKEKRKLLKITQRGLADRAGVGLRFIRDAEQGKKNLELAKINQVLALFGHRMGPVPIDRKRDNE
jgi:y4mF family transcriptional regulator